MIREALSYVLNIAVLISLIFFLRWVGVKGIISLLIGMALMGWLVLSQNIIFMSFIKLIDGELYEKTKETADELNKKKSP